MECGESWFGSHIVLKHHGEETGKTASGGGRGDRLDRSDADVQKCSFQARWTLRREAKAT